MMIFPQSLRKRCPNNFLSRRWLKGKNSTGYYFLLKILSWRFCDCCVGLGVVVMEVITSFYLILAFSILQSKVIIPGTVSTDVPPLTFGFLFSSKWHLLYNLYNFDVGLSELYCELSYTKHYCLYWRQNIHITLQCIWYSSFVSFFKSNSIAKTKLQKRREHSNALFKSTKASSFLKRHEPSSAVKKSATNPAAL